MRLSLRANACVVQIGLEPICRAIAAYMQLELFRVWFGDRVPAWRCVSAKGVSTA
ncbi:hypothetical protein PPNK14_12190 [Pectobacterium parmentieri]